MDNDTKQALEAMEARIIEQMRDTETKLLKAFYGWGRTTDAKLRALPLMDERLVNMEERITEVERKLLDRFGLRSNTSKFTSRVPSSSPWTSGPERRGGRIPFAVWP